MTIMVRKVRGPWLALGLAAHFVARREPFSSFPASDLIRTLSAEVHRGHYAFAFDPASDPARVVGYIGWALYDLAAAIKFAATGVPPTEELSSGGDVLWILTLAAASREAFLALVKATRALHPAHRVMAVRHKSDGRRLVIDRRGRDGGTPGSRPHPKPM